MHRRQAIVAGLLLILQCLLICVAPLETVCLEESSGMQVSLTSYKNEIGNWITEVGLDSEGKRGLVEAIKTNRWFVEVDSNTKTCKGAGSSLHVTLTIKSPLPKVKPDYELFPGLGFYKFHNAATTWPLARKICDDEDAHLLILNSENEADVVKTFFSRYPTITGAANNDYLWIGVERKSGKYWTIHGDPLNSTGFMRFDPGQPKKRADDNCLVVSRPTRGYHDTICEWKVGFICEHEL